MGAFPGAYFPAAEGWYCTIGVAACNGWLFFTPKKNGRSFFGAAELYQEVNPVRSYLRITIFWMLRSFSLSIIR